MKITLEEARTLDAVARSPSFSFAARSLKKGHTAVVYSLKSLEVRTGLTLLDRSRYRTRLTPAGTRVLETCRKLLSVEGELETLCEEIKSGWEPKLTIVFDGIHPLEPIFRPLKRLSRHGATTRVDLHGQFLGGVEETFDRLKAHIMISVLPTENGELETHKLQPICSFLVAAKDHPLTRPRGTRTMEEMQAATLLTIRGSDHRLNLSTAILELNSTFHLNDFHSKKLAILNGMGFGWLPKHLIERELETGTLKVIRWHRSSMHLYPVRLFHRSVSHLGRAATLFLKEFVKSYSDPTTTNSENLITPNGLTLNPVTR